MERFQLWRRDRANQQYQPVYEADHEEDIVEDAGEIANSTTLLKPASEATTRRFSSLEYAIFLLLGLSLLLPWNIFLAASPYFQQRFATSKWILDNFQATETSVSTVTNLGSMLILAGMQRHASYPRRILIALVLISIVFGILALSTIISSSAQAYFALVILMMFLASLAAGFFQNGLFAYVTGFSQPSYIQGIMTGQAVAGVLPPMAQIASVLITQRQTGSDGNASSPDIDAPPVPWTAALAYFLTATVVSSGTLVCFLFLLSRTRELGTIRGPQGPAATGDEEPRKSIPLRYLFWKFPCFASGVFLTFAVTMIFPVYTTRIVSVSNGQSRLLQPATFIPLAFLFWNTGDLFGRLLTAVPAISLVRKPRVVLSFAAARLAYLGLYQLCNLQGRGAVVSSDFFYLVVVQLSFGLTNGFLGSTCMMAVGVWADPEEAEAAGAFMSLCLVGGLAAGSLATFFISGV